MKTRYKIILSNKNLYKEVELSPDASQVRIGTGIECDYRLRKEFFFDSICFTLNRRENNWVLVCSDNLYISVGDIRKLATKELTHGDVLSIRYQDSGNEVLTFDYQIDFNDGNIRYERAFDIAGLNNFSIGTAPSSSIVIRSDFLSDDCIGLQKQNGSLLLTIVKAKNGVYHNGNKTGNRTVIQNGDFFSVSDCFFYYKDGKLWTEKGSKAVSSSIPFKDAPDRNTYPNFVKNTRVLTKISDDKIEILDPPNKGEKPKSNLLMSLLPSLGMLVASGAMAAMGSPTMIIFSGISAVMAIVTAVISMRQGKKDYEKSLTDRTEKYTAYIAQKRQDIEAIRAKEKELLEEIYISPNQESQYFFNFSPKLFDRSREDEDFLFVRLGVGSVEAKRAINYKKQEKLEVEDELQRIPQEMCNEYKRIYGAPIICDFNNSGAVGVVGTQADRYEMMKIIVADMIARQHFDDLQFVFVAENENKDRIRWLRMIPYVMNESINTANIVCDDDSKNLVFEYLYKELTFREQDKKADYQHIVVFLFDAYGFVNHPISKFLKDAKELNVTFVFFGDTVSNISKGCDYIIQVNDATHGTLIDTSDVTKKEAFEYQRISDEAMHGIADLLTPVYTEDISLEGSLTKSISMYELLGIISVDDIDLGQRWSTSKVFKSMAAPIGVSKTSVISLDLHDKAHGPHGLVAGTTGSGKSEILQTYLLSMITLFHPYEVGFVIIDFKGGGMVNQFKNVPHLLGAITNIDGKAINRSLKSIKAELQKRQRLFAEVDVNHIDKYIKKFKEGEAKEPLPHLIIIVDEFAELKAEQPEFMKELISAARIGRSLGVHLILATQKPAGQVNEQIWSNSRFKLCLKVQSQEDSNEVLKSPLAAEIKEPGRAYLQVGNNEIFELFQSAYSGASDKPDDSGTREFRIMEINESGRKSVVFEQKKQKNTDESSTQLDAIVEYVSDYCQKSNIRKLPDICLPALSELISYPEPKDYSKESITADIGIYDDPDNQYQGTYSVNLSEQNVMIIGSAQTGKTNVLQTIIRDLAAKFTPDEVNIYIMDFASMVLKNFETLKHVGGVVTASEDEKLKNLIKLLLSEIEVRREKLLSVGVSSFNSYREAGHTDLPHIVLIVDNLTMAKELYFQDDDVLLNLCREGLSVGISVIVANTQTNGIGFRYLSNFNCKIAMFCNDSSEYYSLFDHCRETLDDIHGRSLVEIDKEHYECQMYLSFAGEKEFERVVAIKEFIGEINAKYPAGKARIIPLIPDILSAEYIDNNFSKEMQDSGSVVIGLDYATVSPIAVNLQRLGVCGISGQEPVGGNTFLRYLLGALERNHPGENEIYIFDSISRDLASFKEAPGVEQYSILGEDACAAMTLIESQLSKRYAMIAEGDENALSSEKLIVIVMNSPDIVTTVCAAASALNSYNTIVGKYRNMKVCVLLGNIDNKAINYSAPEIYRYIRDAKKLFFFGDMSSLKIFDLPLSYLREYKKPLANGECYYINDDSVYKLKTAQDLRT